MDLTGICQEVIAASKDVGAFIMGEARNFDREKIEFKGINNMVSYVDKEAEKRLAQACRKALPAAGFIAEEGTGQESPGGYNWVIDPLDGTTNFIHGIPVFAISIALMKGNELLLGVVHELNHDECFHAVKGGGAYCNQKKIHAAQHEKLSAALIATGFPYYDFEKKDQYMDIIEALMQNSHGLRRMGAASVDLAYVACGRFDAFFEYNLFPWDVAAGSLIVQEAGGTVSDFRGGGDFVFGKELVAASKLAHPQLLDTIATHFYK